MSIMSLRDESTNGVAAGVLASRQAATALLQMLAVWWPSRRAAATDPAIALRIE
jgi:hypothetical protein